MKSITAIIFGGSSGIGEATAMRLSKSGLHIIIVGRDQDRLERARAHIAPSVLSRK